MELGWGWMRDHHPIYGYGWLWLWIRTIQPELLTSPTSKFALCSASFRAAMPWDCPRPRYQFLAAQDTKADISHKVSTKSPSSNQSVWVTCCKLQLVIEDKLLVFSTWVPSCPLRWLEQWMSPNDFIDTDLTEKVTRLWNAFLKKEAGNRGPTMSSLALQECQA